MQECELTDFRRQNSLIRDSYRLTTRHFQLFESAIGNLIPAAGTGTQEAAEEGLPSFLRVAHG